MWNPNTNENVLGWKFVFGSNTLTSVIRQNPPCFKLFCQLWFQTSASAVFWGLVRWSMMRWLRFLQCFYILPHFPSVGAFLLLSDCFVALSCHGFGEWNLFRLLLQELSQVASLEGLWREAPLTGGIGQRRLTVGLRRRLTGGIGEKSLIGGIGDVEQLKASLLFQRSDSTGGQSPARE